MNAARVVMADKGVEATTIQEITDAADVGFGTFYNHFESKEVLIDELVDNARHLLDLVSLLATRALEPTLWQKPSTDRPRHSPLDETGAL